MPEDHAPLPVISPEYRALQAKLHADDPEYGVASVAYAPLVAQVVDQFAVSDLLDYGAGKCRLAKALPQHAKRAVRYTPYEPAMPEWAATPAPTEMVTCIDVLEHIEPSCLDAVLDDLRRVVERIGFFTVHIGPAKRILADGRNAHLIQEPPAWWLPKIMARFELLKFGRAAGGFWVLVLPPATRALSRG